MNFKPSLSIKLVLFSLFTLTQFQSTCQSPRERINELLQNKITNSPVKQMNWNLEIAKYYQQLPDMTDSVKYYASRALDLAIETKNTEIEHAAYYRLGMATWYGDEDFDAAMELFLKAKTILESTGSKTQLPTVNNAIGSIHLMQGAFDKALIHYNEAFQGAKAIQDYEIMAMAGTNMSIIHIKTGDTIKSIKVNEEALASIEAIEDKELDLTKVGILINLGDLYKKTKQYEKAESLIKRTRSIVDELGSFRQQGRLSILEARLLEAMGKKKQLYELVKRVLPNLPKSSGYDREIYTSLLVYQGKAFVENQKFGAARKVTKELETYLGVSNSKHEKNILKSLYVLNQQIGDFEEAFNYLDRFTLLKDSIVNRELQSELIESENKYQLQNKEREIEQEQIKNLELKSRNNRLLLALAGLIIFGLGMYIYYYRKRQRQKEEIDQIEQKILTLQMNPHFIFNAISSIQYYLFEEGDRKKAIHHLSTFATLMRQMLENSRERFIPLHKELDFLTNYLDLQKLRFDDNFDYRIIIDDDINTFDLTIPPLLTQPFVENAIEHGKVYAVENGEIVLKVTKENDRLIIKVIDNGVGMESASMNSNPAPKKDSLSIKITDERLKLLSKLMKTTWKMEIVSDSAKIGTTIQINMPVISVT